MGEYGFEEILLVKPPMMTPPPPPPAASSKAEKEESVLTEPKNPLKEFASALLKAGVLGSAKSPLEKMRDQLVEPEDHMGKMGLAAGIAFNPQFEAAIERERPDVIIVDAFAIPVAVQRASVPYVCLFSAQPLSCLPSAARKLPPFGAGEHKSFKIGQIS